MKIYHREQPQVGREWSNNTTTKDHSPGSSSFKSQKTLRNAPLHKRCRIHPVFFSKIPTLPLLLFIVQGRSEWKPTLYCTVVVLLLQNIELFFIYTFINDPEAGPEVCAPSQATFSPSPKGLAWHWTPLAIIKRQKETKGKERMVCSQFGLLCGSLVFLKHCIVGI